MSKKLLLLRFIGINGVGRPKVSFSSASAPTKRRIMISLHENTTNEALYGVAKKKMRLNGNKKGAQLLDMIADQNTVDEILLSSKKPKQNKMTADEALSMIIEANLTKRSYKFIRSNALKHGHDLYPPYEQVILINYTFTLTINI